jgi:hypothetical protein
VESSSGHTTTACVYSFPRLAVSADLQNNLKTRFERLFAMQKDFNTQASPSAEAEKFLTALDVDYWKKPDGALHVYGDVILRGMGLEKLPDLSMVTVIGTFDCRDNKLTTLKGAPAWVGNELNCSGNRLTSLEGATREVRNFCCDDNLLTSLEHAPAATHNFYCSNNRLTSLEGAPASLTGDFYCDHNNLTSLKGGPRQCGGSYGCYDNQLSSLEFGPGAIGGSFDCSRNRIMSLKGGPVSARFYTCDDNQLKTLEYGPASVMCSFSCKNNPLAFTVRPPVPEYGGLQM